MSVYDVGGSIGETFYSYDIWNMAKTLWELWFKIFPSESYVEFSDLSPESKAKVLDVAYETITMIKERRLV